MAPCNTFPATAASVKTRSSTGIQPFLAFWGREPCALGMQTFDSERDCPADYNTHPP